MAADLSLLEPDFRARVEGTLATCRREGVVLRPFCTIRSTLDQARLWRQSRSTKAIAREIQKLRDNGADYLAWCLERVGAQDGRPVTNAIPGMSWHQWGEACDCFLVVDGEAVWDAGDPGYETYVEVAEEHGLVSGRSWHDIVHVQKRLESVLGAYSLASIDREMQVRYGQDPGSI